MNKQFENLLKSCPSFNTDGIFGDEDLLTWAKVSQTASFKIIPDLQDVYVKSSVGTVKDAILKVYLDNSTKGELPMVMFAIGKVMGNEVQYEAIRTIALFIAEKRSDVLYEEKVKNLADWENEIYQRERDVERAKNDMKTEVEGMEAIIATLELKVERLETEVSELEDVNGILRDDVGKYKGGWERWSKVKGAFDILMK